MNSVDHLRTTQTFFLPVFNYAVLIEREYGDFIVPAPEGIYRVGDIHPCIHSNKRYYSQKLTKTNQYISAPVTDINLVNDTIIDETGNVILPAYVMKNKEQYLRNEPTVPARGLLIVELLIKKYIESVSPWVKYSMYNSKIASYFKPEGVELFYNGHIEALCESLFAQVCEFIGNDVWHVYFVKFMGLDLMIEKTTDWRILEYYRMTNEQKETEYENNHT